jgi:hypothetical protein
LTALPPLNAASHRLSTNHDGDDQRDHPRRFVQHRVVTDCVSLAPSHHDRAEPSTDPDDYPPERTAYAMRAPDRLVRQALALGPHIGQFAERLLDAPFPRSKMRQGQRLLRLAERYTPERLEAACTRALGFDLVDVRRLERIIVLALEHEGQLAPPADERVQPLPSSRFAHPGTAFDHRFAAHPVEIQP